MDTNPFEILEDFATRPVSRDEEYYSETRKFLSEFLTSVSEDESESHLPDDFFEWIETAKSKVHRKAVLQIGECIEEIAENINACLGIYLDREDILEQKASAATRGNKPSRSLFDLLDETLRKLDSDSSITRVRCDVKLATKNGAALFTGTAVVLPVIAASDPTSRELLGAIVFLLRSDSLGPKQTDELERECLRVTPHAWIIRSLRDRRCLLPTICKHEGWTSSRYIRRMCRFFVEQFCPGGKDGFFSASLWYSDPPFEKLYVHSTYGYDYCFQKKALPIASSCIGKQLTAGDGKVARYTPDDDDYREKDKAEMAGVQSLHVVEVGMEAPEKMAFVCHCFDANWRNYSPELSAFRHFGNLVEKFASSAERWKIRHALMDLNWRFAYAARMNNEVLPIEYLSRILRDRLAAFFESRGCTIFLAEGDGTELYPIATFGLREDRLRSHEGRLVPEREIVAYDLTQRGLLKLLVECPRLAVSVNDLEDYKNIVKSYPFLVHRKPRRELQESSLSSMDDSRFLGVGLQFPKLKFVIRLSRRLSDPPFRNADKQLLLAISQFLEANSLWNSAVDSLATTFSASAYRAWPSSCDPGCTDDQEIDLDILRENCNGECG